MSITSNLAAAACAALVTILASSARAQLVPGDLLLVGQGLDPNTGQGSPGIPEVVIADASLMTTRLNVTGLPTRVTSAAYDAASGTVYVSAGRNVYILAIAGTSATAVLHCPTPAHSENWQMFLGHNCWPVVMRPAGAFLECPTGGPAVDLFPANPFTRLEAGWYDASTGFYWAVDRPASGQYQLYRIDPLGPVFTAIGATYSASSHQRVFPDGNGGAWIAAGGAKHVDSAGVVTNVSLTPSVSICRMSPVLGTTSVFRSWACNLGPDDDLEFVDLAGGVSQNLLSNVPNFNAPGNAGGGIWDCVEIAAPMPRALSFGAACADSGTTTNTLTLSGCPERSGSFRFGMATGSLGPAVLIAGFAAPPPVPLDPLGAFGCSIYLTHDIPIPFGPNGGAGVMHSMQIPPFVGPPLHLFFQAYHLDPLANPLGVVASNGIDVTL